jgi:SAM-dependent methyltransferase
MGSIQDMDDLDIAYKLPRGGREAIRLTAQHHVLSSRQGWTIHPTISSALKDIPTPRIVDVATGTGVWALDIAQQMPHAKVVGLDISDQQFPPSWTWPTNLSLRLYDLLQEVPAELHGQFDVVHVRLLLVAGPLVDKSIFINRFRTLLRPGGWLQWDDLEFPHVSACYPSPSGVLKSADPGAHPICHVMEKYLGFHDKAGWLSKFEEVLVQLGGFEETQRFEIPVQAHLLQMESDLVVSVMVEMATLQASRNGARDPVMSKEFYNAVAALQADVLNGALFSYNWNVCIARKDLGIS